MDTGRRLALVNIYTAVMTSVTWVTCTRVIIYFVIARAWRRQDFFIETLKQDYCGSIMTLKNLTAHENISYLNNACKKENQTIKATSRQNNNNYIKSKPIFSEQCEAHHEHMETIYTHLSPSRIFFPRSRADTCKHTFLILVGERDRGNMFLFQCKDRSQS